ncbi:MAG: hypothetical protein KGL95_12950, partial [Patescibacteria group bacterium]|nr:hypothetical protein [Patescibacteria group bacterium]
LFFYPQNRHIFDFFTRLDVNDNQQTWIPGWFKNVANWYSKDLISGRDLANSMEYLIEQGILQISQTQSNNTMAETFPAGIKENAQKWSENVVSDNDFSKTIQFLINDGIINLNSY